MDETGTMEPQELKEPKEPNGPDADKRIQPAKSIEYWSSRASTVDSMLGGYSCISRTDLRGSAAFYAKHLKSSLHGDVDGVDENLGNDSNKEKKEHEKGRGQDQGQGQGQGRGQDQQKSIVGVDCGAGIGRVTAGFLSTVCTTIDCVEPIQSFTEEIRRQACHCEFHGKGTLGEIFVTGLAGWNPTRHKYNLIWNQWCCLYLTDMELISYLRRCGQALKDKSRDWIVVKENTTKDAPLSISPNHPHHHLHQHNQHHQPHQSHHDKENTQAIVNDQKDIFDEEDSSVTRSNAKYLDLFEKAGMRVYANELQKGFARDLGLYPVRMYALRPK